MTPFYSLYTPTSTPSLLFPPFKSLPRFNSLPPRIPSPLFSFPPNNTNSSSSSSSSSSSLPPQLPTNHDLPRQQQQQQQPPRTVFPGGYKRPEIKIPTVLLRLTPDDVLDDSDALDFLDAAVSKHVGIVVLEDGGGGGGKKLYDAACLLKSVVRDRAYLLIGDRVDIASSINASGVSLSDQGLPAIVARNMMMSSKSESVVLPLVARNVQTPEAALTASNSEGADLLIYTFDGEKHSDVEREFVFDDVKIPVFVSFDSSSFSIEGFRFVKSGASGVVTSLEGLRMFGDDALSQLMNGTSIIDERSAGELGSVTKIRVVDGEGEGEPSGKVTVAGFLKLEEREKQLVEIEKLVFAEVVNVIQKAAPLMEEISLLKDAISRIDEPFLLAIVGEFNSGKSTVINALLGKRYLKEGVVPTTNEITFLRYSKYDSEEPQRCEHHPDGQYICYLPAPILKEMNIVDTPGTNVILQRQQRLTEEFVPRADLLLFVISADRPLTESEVAFLRYTQQWKKKVVFVLNKADLYQNTSELEEVISFIKGNAMKMLNAEKVTLFAVSARSALEAKLIASYDIGEDYSRLAVSESNWKISSFYELERFLYSFLDGSTSTGMERMKLKLGTPIGIAERLLSACETLVKQDFRFAKQDLASATELVDSVKDYAMKMENESVSWKRKTLSLIDSTKSCVLELIESTLQLSNLDLVLSFLFRGEKSAVTPASAKVQNDIIGPALSDAQQLMGEYVVWLQSNNSREGKLYMNSFEKKWPSFNNPSSQKHLESYDSLTKVNNHSLKVIENFSARATSKRFEEEIREVFLGTFGGLGAAGFSASLLTSVLPTTLEDLLALGLCSAGGYIAIANFPSRKRAVLNKASKLADGLAHEVEEAMQKDLMETVGNLEIFVKTIGKPYQDGAKQKLDQLLGVQDELSNVGNKIRTLQVDIQNLHVS